MTRRLKTLGQLLLSLPTFVKPRKSFSVIATFGQPYIRIAGYGRLAGYGLPPNRPRCGPYRWYRYRAKLTKDVESIKKEDRQKTRREKKLGRLFSIDDF